MPDYNIYLHTIGGSGEESPTSPRTYTTSRYESGDGFSPADKVVKAENFIQNPDSLIARVINSPIGVAGVTGVAIMGAVKITDKVFSNFNAYSSSASGDYKTAVDYNNWKNQIHNFFHPISNNIQVFRNNLEIRKRNLQAEQQRNLLGGTMLNSPYGRYL